MRRPTCALTSLSLSLSDISLGGTGGWEQDVHLVEIERERATESRDGKRGESQGKGARARGRERRSFERESIGLNKMLYKRTSRAQANDLVWIWETEETWSIGKKFILEKSLFHGCKYRSHPTSHANEG
jgi:hypothetical protein